MLQEQAGGRAEARMIVDDENLFAHTSSVPCNGRFQRAGIHTRAIRCPYTVR
jgi:hypothetical protein